MRKLLFVLLAVINLFNNPLSGQSISAGDCEGALPVTNGYYDYPIMTYPSNTIQNEINPLFSCLSGGEVNGIWFEFMILDSGMLSFNIIPYNSSDDFDWALFNIASATCIDIFDSSSLEVRCDYSNSIVHSGITGANGGPNNQDEPTLMVIPGQAFKLFVSNYSGSTVGFQIDMDSSTCTFDPVIGISENNISAKINIGPNPSNGFVNLTIDESLVKEIMAIQIMDLTGKIIFDQSSGFTGSMLYDLSNQVSGIYFVQIYTPNQQHSFKLVVQ